MLRVSAKNNLDMFYRHAKRKVLAVYKKLGFYIEILHLDFSQVHVYWEIGWFLSLVYFLVGWHAIAVSMFPSPLLMSFLPNKPAPWMTSFLVYIWSNQLISLYTLSQVSLRTEPDNSGLISTKSNHYRQGLPIKGGSTLARLPGHFPWLGLRLKHPGLFCQNTNYTSDKFYSTWQRPGKFWLKRSVSDVNSVKGSFTRPILYCDFAIC